MAEATAHFLAWVPQPCDVVVHLSFAYAEIPMPAEFDMVFSYGDPAKFVPARATVTHAIGNGLFALDTLAEGWRHVVVLRFHDAVPELVAQLPETMGPLAHWVGLFRKADFEAIRAGIVAPPTPSAGAAS